MDLSAELVVNSLKHKKSFILQLDLGHEVKPQLTSYLPKKQDLSAFVKMTKRKKTTSGMQF